MEVNDFGMHSFSWRFGLPSAHARAGAVSTYGSLFDAHIRAGSCRRDPWGNCGLTSAGGCSTESSLNVTN